MSNSLIDKRCFHHRGREAAAHCLECGRFFCRECVTEHDDRFVCALCLRRLAAGQGRRRSFGHGLRLTVAVAAGLLAGWLFFFIVGKVLLLIPTEYHEGTFWRSDRNAESKSIKSS
jgi:hypothetical protein